MKKVLFIILFLASVAYGGAVKAPKGIQLSTSHPLSRGLKGAWFFNEGTSVSIYDSSVSNTIGTLTDGTAWASGKYGSCLQFDGTNDFVGLTDFEDVAENDQAGTFIFWVKFDDFDVYQTIFMHSVVADDQRYISIYTRPAPAGAVTVIFRKDTGLLGANYTGFMTTSTLTVDTWQQVAVSSDGSTFRIYIDGHKQIIAALGASVNNGNWFADLTSDTYSSFLGKWERLAEASYYFDGQQDHVLYYDRALTAAEITWLYQEPFAMFDKGLGFLSGFATPPAISRTQTIIIAGRTWSFRAMIFCLMIMLCSKYKKQLTMVVLLTCILTGSAQALMIEVPEGGTGRATWTQYSIPYLDRNDTFGEIPIGDPGQYLQVIPDWSNRGYQWDWITTDDVTEGARLYCTLENVRSVLGNDFHSIGGVDDDTPDDTSEIPTFHIHWDSWWYGGEITDADIVDGTITGSTISGVAISGSTYNGGTIGATTAVTNAAIGNITIDGTVIASTDDLIFKSNDDEDDYFYMHTESGLSTLNFFGCKGRIYSSEGETLFGDDKVSTTGIVEGGTITEGGNAVWNATETEIIDSDHYVDGSIDLVHLAAGVYAKDIVTTAPLTGGTDNVLVGADGDVTIAMPVATTSADGYLAQTDWDKFNDHADDSTQAHSDYLLNSGADSTSGNLSAVGFTSSDLVTINQSADSDGIQIFGYDDKSANAWETYIAATGNIETNTAVGPYRITSASYMLINSSTDFYCGLGDTAGANHFYVRDSGGSVQFSVDSDGKVTNLYTHGNTVTSGVRSMFIDDSGVYGGISSTRRHKTDIVDLTDSNNIYNLRPREYTRIATGEHEFGLIAEEVELAMPELVTYETTPVYEDVNDINAPEGYRREHTSNTIDYNIPETVEYYRLIVPMLHQIQLLEARITELEKKI